MSIASPLRTRSGRALLVVACALAATAAPVHAALDEEPGSPMAAGTEPWWATTADFDGNGLPDVAVANDDSASPAGTVSVLLRQPLGGFAAEEPITVGARPDSLVAADFNGDGRPDLAVANFLSSTVTVLLRRADNTGFTAEGAPVPVGTSPHAVAAGDVNGDGRIDLVTASHALSTVTVLLRKADGSGFAEEAGSPVAVGANPTQIALADFDGDGRLDVATANHGSDDVTVLLRDTGNDGFTAEAGPPAAAGDAPVGLVSTDFDGDGRPDLAVTGETSDDVSVLLRQEGGGFAVASGSPHPAGDGAYGVVAADFSADGRPDLAVTAFAGNRVTVLHGTGNGDFEQPSFSPLPTSKGPLVLAAADFDANGRPDLVIPNHGAHTVTVRLNQADAVPAPVLPPPPGCAPPSTDRVALWRGEDNARDSVGGHDGSLENGGAYRDGAVGRAFSLAGSDDYLHVPDRPDLDVTGDLTFDAWVQIDDTNFGATDPFGVGGDRVIVAKPDATDSAVTLAFWIEGDTPATAQSAPLAFAAGPRSDASTVVTSDALSWQPGTWYHVAVVRSGSAVAFYRDGVAAGAATIGGTPAATPRSPVALGASPHDATIFNPLVGGLDEAGLWSRALSAAEIQELRDTATGACHEPGTTLTSTPPALTNDPTPTFEFGSDTPGAMFECELDAGAWSVCTSPHTTAPLADGRHRFRVRAGVDAARSRRPALGRADDPDPPAFEFVVDTTPPETTITAGPEEGATVIGATTFEFTSGEDGSTFTCAIGGGPLGCASPHPVDPGPGAWIFAVAATDAAGNADPTPAQRSFTTRPPAPTLPPRSLSRPAIFQARQCGTGVGGACRTLPSTYRCDPGSWEGRDDAMGYGYAWQRVSRDTAGQYADGWVPGATIAYGETFHARSETRAGLDPSRWLIRCGVEAYNAAGKGLAWSEPRQLEPELDRLASQPYGNFRIRGIDVFQVVQPLAGSQAFGYTPGSDAKTNATNTEHTYGATMAGGGTPTNWRFGPTGGAELPEGADAQSATYDAVPLDETKPTRAVVYLDRSYTGTGYDPDQKLLVTLRGRVDGATVGSITQTATRPPVGATRYVRIDERGDPAEGEQFDVPAEWLTRGRGAEGGLTLEAGVELQRNADVRPVYQCDGRCTRDDTFRLDDIEVGRLPILRIDSVEVREKGDTWSASPEGVLRRARQIFPGGERMEVVSTGAKLEVEIPDEAPDYRCLGEGEIRDCQSTIVDLALIAYDVYRMQAGTADYDALMGMHEYGDPGWTLIGSNFEFEPGTSTTPIFTTNAGSKHRPLTAAAHELGHVLGLPHAGRDCRVPRGFTLNETGSGGQAGEVWPGERGRLAGVRFDQFRSGLDARRFPNEDGPTKITPDVDQGADPARPLTLGADQNPALAGNLLDLMSYCNVETGDPKAWLSARNWNHTYRTLTDFVQRLGPLERAVRLRATAAQSRPSIAVGAIGPGGARVDRVLPAPAAAPQDPAPGGTQLLVRSLDAGGRVLLESAANVRPSSEGDGETSVFTATVAPGTASVQVVRDQQVVGERRRTAPPSVRLLGPRRGARVGGAGRSALAVRWTASDPDGEPLLATVEYSPDDGRSWAPLHQGPSTGSVRLPGRFLAGSRRARVRVTVDDGFSQAHAVSPPFRAAGTPPVPRIVRPRGAETLREGERVVLAGAALDDRHRRLGGRALTWFAGRLRLGTGTHLRTSLPAGRYALRLVTRDRTGRTATAATWVRVGRALLRVTTLRHSRAVRRGARSLTLAIATSQPATLTVAGRRLRIGPRVRRIAVPLPRSPRTGLLRIRTSIARAGAGARPIGGTLGVLRG